MPGKLNAPPTGEPVQKVRFGNFEIMNDPEGRPLALGKGTFGRTYQARHCYLDTIVALKIITERYAADETVRQRFLIEARAVAKLSHPHIARLYDFGEVDGVLHYAMEYCGGGSLADHVAKHGPLGLRQVLEVAQQMAGALKCAHAAGFIHRDLKPSNIMLTADEDPLFAKLIDFGLVQPSMPGATRSIADDQSVDGARFLGTPLFASPEQLREEPMDLRTDLFSFGMTLWYLLLGGPPESGSSAAIAASRLGPESYAARLPANLTPQVRDVLSKLLEKDRNRRFGAAAEVFAALNLCAASLGFHRARDYTDPGAELADWENDQSSAQAASQTTEPKPVDVQKVDAELSSEFSILARINEDFTGLNYAATPNSQPEDGVILHVLHPMLLEDAAAFNRLRVHVAQLMMLDGTEVVRPKALKAYSDYVSILLEKPGGTDLMSILRTERTVHLFDVAPLLESIADACDALCAAGLPGVQLAPGRVFIEWETGAEPGNTGGGSQLRKARPRLYPRFLAVSEAPELARVNEPEDVSSTMTTDMLSDSSRADNMPEHFGTLLYRVVAGRNCPMAAALSSQAYVAIPGLSEHSNRLLSLVIAKQIASTSCGQVLREILGAEGIVPRVPGHPSAGFTGRSGSTVTPLAGAPLLTPSPTSFATATPPLVEGKQSTTARTWRPPTVGRSPPPAPVVAKPSPPFAPVSQPPAAAVELPPAPEPIAAPVVTAKAPADSSAPPVKPLPVETTPSMRSGVAKTLPPVIDIPKAPITPLTEPIAKKTSKPDPMLATEPASPYVIEIPKAPIKPPAEPIVKQTSKPAPAEARAKDSIPAPEAKGLPKKTVSKPAEERRETLPPQAPTVAKEKALADAKSEAAPPRIPTKPQPAEEKSFVPAEDKKRDRPPIAPKMPVVLPTPPQPAVISKRETDAAETKPPGGALWQDPKIRWIGIGIAALLVLSVSYATFRRPSNPRVTSAKSSKIVPVPIAPPAPHPSAAVVPPVSNTPAIVANKPSPPRISVAGHYVGQVRDPQASGSASMSVEREISIDPGLTSGYLVDYGSDPTKQIQFADGQVDPDGVYTARANFSSAMGAAHNDENLTVRRGENGLEVSFKGRQTSGAEYTLDGVLHPWTGEDQTRYRDLVAEAAQKQKAADAAKLMVAAPLKPPSKPEVATKAQTQDNGRSSTKANRRAASATGSAPKGGGGEHHTTRSRASEVAAKPPARPAPAPKPTSEPQQRPHREFEGSNPGG